MSKKAKIAVAVTGGILILAVIGLSVALGIIEKRRRTNEEKLGYIYEKSYYETVNCMSDVELKLDKVSVLQGRELRRELLRLLLRFHGAVVFRFGYGGFHNLLFLFRLLLVFAHFVLSASSGFYVPLTDRISVSSCASSASARTTYAMIQM